MQKSIQNLSEPSQKALAILGKIAHQSFDIHMLEEVLEFDARAIREIIAELRRYGLLTYDTAPKLIHPLLHTFINQHLDLETSLLKRTFQHYTSRIIESFFKLKWSDMTLLEDHISVINLNLMRLSPDLDFRMHMLNVDIFLSYFEMIIGHIVKNTYLADDEILAPGYPSAVVISLLLGMAFLITKEPDKAKIEFEKSTRYTLFVPMLKPEAEAMCSLCLCHLEPDLQSALSKLKIAEKYFSKAWLATLIVTCYKKKTYIREKYHMSIQYPEKTISFDNSDASKEV